MIMNDFTGTGYPIQHLCCPNVTNLPGPKSYGNNGYPTQSTQSTLLPARYTIIYVKLISKVSDC